jgi:hypothetical protein
MNWSGQPILTTEVERFKLVTSSNTTLTQPES